MTGALTDQENQENTKVTKTPGKQTTGKQTITRKKEKHDQENRNFCLFMQTMSRICLCQTLLPDCFYGFFEVQKPQNFLGAAPTPAHLPPGEPMAGS